MSIHIDVLDANLEVEPPQHPGPGERTPPATATLAPKDVLRLVEQRIERNLRLRAH